MTAHALLAACALAATAACSSTDTNRANDQAGKTMQDITKAARSVATSAPVLAASDGLQAIAVKARLAAADIDSSSGVSVSAHAGTVTLKGTVRTSSEIATLRDAARSVSGVKAVRTELRVDRQKPTASEQAGNLALSARVMANVASQAGLNALSVHADAKDGVVTLSGTARTVALKATIVDAARKTQGVRAFNDRVKVVR